MDFYPFSVIFPSFPWISLIFLLKSGKTWKKGKKGGKSGKKGKNGTFLHFFTLFYTFLHFFTLFYPFLHFFSGHFTISGTKNILALIFVKFCRKSVVPIENFSRACK